jgi:hypothetical protein
MDEQLKHQRVLTEQHSILSAVRCKSNKKKKGLYIGPIRTEANTIPMHGLVFT